MVNLTSGTTLYTHFHHCESNNTSKLYMWFVDGIPSGARFTKLSPVYYVIFRPMNRSIFVSIYVGIGIGILCSHECNIVMLQFAFHIASNISNIFIMFIWVNTIKRQNYCIYKYRYYYFV